MRKAWGRFSRFFRRRKKRTKELTRRVEKQNKRDDGTMAQAKELQPKRKEITKEQRGEVVRVALSQVGVKEIGGNNQGSKIREYQAATWLEPAPWPWCAAFVCWVFDQIKLPYPRPRTAGAFDFARWAKKVGLKVVDPESWVEAGDIIIFDFSHIGIAVEDSDDVWIETVEGNTGPDGGRDGDGVWKKTRHRSLIRHIIRP